MSETDVSSIMPQDLVFTAVPPTGAVLSVRHMGREVKGYVLTEPELKIVSSASALTATFLTAATGLLTFVVGLWTEAVFTGELTTEGKALLYVVSPICAILCGLCFFAAWRAQRTRKSELTNIIEAGGGNARLPQGNSSSIDQEC